MSSSPYFYALVSVWLGWRGALSTGTGAGAVGAVSIDRITLLDVLSVRAFVANAMMARIATVPTTIARIFEAVVSSPIWVPQLITVLTKQSGAPRVPDAPPFWSDRRDYGFAGGATGIFSMSDLDTAATRMLRSFR